MEVCSYAIRPIKNSHDVFNAAVLFEYTYLFCILASLQEGCFDFS
jgi:hypothetical protein